MSKVQGSAQSESGASLGVPKKCGGQTFRAPPVCQWARSKPGGARENVSELSRALARWYAVRSGQSNPNKTPIK